MNIHVLIEGEFGKSQDILWRNINKLLYNDNLLIVNCNGISKVLSVLNTELAKLNEQERGSDIFILDLDMILESHRILTHISNIQKAIYGFNNIYILDLICFEDTVLTFKYLVDWLYGKYKVTNNTQIQQKIILLNEYFTCGGNYLESNLLDSFVKSQTRGQKFTITQETIAHLLLSYLTVGTNFLATKDKFGVCYYCDCLGKDCTYTKGVNKNVPLELRNGLCIDAYNQMGITSVQKLQILYSASRIGLSMQKAKNYFLKHGYQVAKYII